MKILFKFFLFLPFLADCQKFTDSLSAVDFANRKLIKFYNKGFLIASYSVFYKNGFYKVKFSKKTKFYCNKFIIKGLDKKINLPLKTKRYFSEKKLNQSIYKILDFYANNGYPFARVSIDSIVLDSNFVDVFLTVEKYRKFYLNKIFTNQQIVNQAFIYNFLGLKKGQSYSKQKIDNIPRQFSSVDFIDFQKFELEFYDSLFDIYLYLKKRKANNFSGFLSFRNDKKLTILGNFQVQFFNLFSKAEYLKIDWAKTQANSQKLILSVKFPYLLSMPIGLETQLNFYKQDSSFVNVGLKNGLSYFFYGLNYLAVSYFWQKSIKLSENSDYQNITKNLFGLRFYLSNLQNPINPKKGILADVQTFYGYKLADSVFWENRLTANFSFFVPISNIFVFSFSQKIGLISSEKIFKNEVFRIGGFNSLRGIDQDQIYSNAFFINSAEFKLMISDNSNIHFFNDLAYCKIYDLKKFQKFISFGLGFQFGFKNGIIVLDLANLISENFNFLDTKIHIGLKTFF